jgi:biopolymer transport protein ExbD
MDAGGKKGGVKADINVTPLVDIVLVLLIIFIVITPAVNDSVKLPLAKHSPKVEKTPGAKYITLYFNAKHNDRGEYLEPGNITCDDSDAKSLVFNLGNPDSKQKLVDFVNRNVSQLEDKRVFIKADADLPFKYVNTLFQVCREGGADEASIVTSEEKKKEEGGK